MVFVACSIYNGVVGTDAYQRVYMSVGVIAYQTAMVEPYDALGTQPVFQPLFNRLLGKGLIAVGRHQTAKGGEDGPLAVALDAASLEHEVQMVLVGAFHQSLLIEMLVDLIVEFGRELLAPAVELEVEQKDVWPLLHGDEAMVAGPSVVGRQRQEGGGEG